MDVCLQGTKALAVALVTNTSVLKLNLRDNWMEGLGGAAIAEMLKENCYITGGLCWTLSQAPIPPPPTPPSAEAPPPQLTPIFCTSTQFSAGTPTFLIVECRLCNATVFDCKMVGVSHRTIFHSLFSR